MNDLYLYGRDSEEDEIGMEAENDMPVELEEEEEDFSDFASDDE